MLRINEAQRIILDNVKSSYVEKRSIIESLGRSLVDDMRADRDYPPYNRATMDGFAIKSSSINENKIQDFKVKAKTLAGAPPFEEKLSKTDCVAIMTGSKVPLYADTVIPIEQCTLSGASLVRINLSSVKSGKNVSIKGEDIKQGELVIPSKTLIDEALINLLSSFGYSSISVYQAPKVSIISTGDEVVSIDKSPKDYQIRDSNSYTIRALLKSVFGIDASFVSLVSDNEKDLEAAIGKGLNYDILIISGGVSMGEADFVPSVLEGLKVKKIFHKVRIKPGKPIWFGSSSKGVVFGLPGNPLSCQVTFKLFIEPYIRSFMKLPASKTVKLRLGEERRKRTDREDYFPCKADYSKGEISLLKYSGSGDIKAGFGSSGFARHPLEEDFLPKGTIVDFHPWVSIC